MRPLLQKAAAESLLAICWEQKRGGEESQSLVSRHHKVILKMRRRLKHMMDVSDRYHTKGNRYRYYFWGLFPRCIFPYGQLCIKDPRLHQIFFFPTPFSSTYLQLTSPSYQVFLGGHGGNPGPLGNPHLPPRGQEHFRILRHLRQLKLPVLPQLFLLLLQILLNQLLHGQSGIPLPPLHLLLLPLPLPLPIPLLLPHPFLPFPLHLSPLPWNSAPALEEFAGPDAGADQDLYSEGGVNILMAKAERSGKNIVLERDWRNYQARDSRKV